MRLLGLLGHIFCHVGDPAGGELQREVQEAIVAELVAAVQRRARRRLLSVAAVTVHGASELHATLDAIICQAAHYPRDTSYGLFGQFLLVLFGQAGVPPRLPFRVA